MKFITNLNGTILCPYQILLDIAGQIPNSPPRIRSLAFTPICDLNSTNDWINLESLGKPVAIRAKLISNALCSLFKVQQDTRVILDVYCADGQLQTDNLYSLLFLAQSLSSLEINFFTQDDATQKILQEQIAPLTDEHNAIFHFQQSTQAPELLAQLEHTREKIINSLGFFLNDRIFSGSELPESTVNQLIGFSWMCLKSGGYDIACRVLERAQKHPGVQAKAQEQLFMHLLMIRFFSHQYALIAESEFPEQFHYLEPEEVRTLQFLTAYSATLSRNLTVANKFFAQCAIHAEMPLSDEHSLYQLNLFALSRVLQGEIDTAFQLEFRIKDFIEQQHIHVVGLNYVNFINIARLYKKTKEFDLSLDYYNKAYEQISGGGYASSDHIYYNMNLGSLHEAANNPQKALNYWIKAAIHWLACDNKYVLSWRPRLILCSEKITDIGKPLSVDKANLFLWNKINELIEACQLDLSQHTPAVYQFVEDGLNIEKESCLIHENIVLYCTNNLGTPQHNPSATEKKLSYLISQYLQAILDLPAQQQFFIIDTHLDVALLRHNKEASAYASLSHCSSCYFNGQWITLNESNPLKTMTTSLSKAIDSIDLTERGLAVKYTRSFLNKMLVEPDEIDLVNQLKENKTMNLEHADANLRALLHQLAQKRVLNFAYAD